MLGVISHRAAIGGSYPRDSDAGEGDTVAYCGRVPVKLIGSARAGNTVVPSGRGDGTAIAVGSCGALCWRARVGIVEIDLDESGSTNHRNSSSHELELLSLDKGSTGQAWQYVDCSVVSPSSSYGPLNILYWAILGVVLTGVCVAVAVATRAQTHVEISCRQLVLDHGNVTGTCDGRAGSSCEYGACELGYTLALDRTSRETDSSVDAARPPGGCLNRSISHPFPVCTTCFGDGLMCEPKNRTYPLPPPTQPTGTGQFAEWPKYPYTCPSSIGDLQSCEPEGRLCFGPYNGYPPCEYCNVVQDGSGIACEASSRYVRWGLRGDNDDHYKCLSSKDPDRNALFDVYDHILSPCECPKSDESSLFVPPYDNGCYVLSDPDDIVRTAKYCIPIGDLTDTPYQDPPARSASSTWCSPARVSNTQSATAPTIRHCNAKPTFTGQLSAYDGTDMYCARVYCPAEELGALRIDACRLCEGKEAIVSIPR